MITVDVNQQVEMMNIILYTSKYNDICKNMIGFSPIVEDENDYTREIYRYFKKFSHHKIYSKLEEMLTEGFFLGRPMELCLSLNPLNYLESKYKMNELSVDMSGGEICVEEFKKLFDDYRKETDFDKFFMKSKDYYKNSIFFINNHLNYYSFVDELNKFFGTNNVNYNFIVSDLCKGNFGIHFELENELYIYSIYSSYGIDIRNESNSFDKEDVSNTIFHELSHPIINPLSIKHKDLINKYKNIYEYLKSYRNKYTGYKDWEECVNEHIIRAISIYMLKKHNRNEYVCYRIKYERDLGYRYIEKIIEKLKYYENNRLIYHTIDDFYPEIIEVFSENI